MRPKALGEVLVLRRAFGSGGHRPRTRHGHCVKCKPATLDSQARSAFGNFYIAASLRLNWTKAARRNVEYSAS
ncbi:hypothetical protein GOD53_21970 [Sinorhizobium medicae]|nr:hypothetical protein [Sinorhizobium medicae]MDX0747383.1 hypothetical protein [Sinorhizobium medicae]